ncbi:hypothetical protein Agub_g5885 [Astrephomene gubernaculifera]|uniref:RTA1-like protein n=1 Tax=Astrephomene gubernaculifera TaxID=47775 RepID=A0AAD3HL00_9CHLO|nr:hypothetical protein Agub_g5885 [Astrephomene gubernaculifera]
MPQTDEQILIQYFHEIPKSAPAYAALVLYFIGGLIVFFQSWKTKAWFMTVVSATAWLEVIGFGFRVAMIASPDRLVFIMMQCFLIITPVILPLVDYIVVGRLMRFGDGSKLFMKPHWVARFFLTSDFFCLFLQGGGGGLISSDNPKSQQLGQKVILIGLFGQLGFFTFFTFLTVYIQRSKSFALQERVVVPSQIFTCLYVTIAMMYVRNIFRCVEFIMGYDGYLASHEEFFYAFDFAMIFGCILVFSALFFGYYMPDMQEVTPVQSAVEMTQGTEKVIVRPSPRNSGSENV